MSRMLVTFLLAFFLVPAEVLPQSSPPLGLDGRPVDTTEDLSVARVPKRAPPSPEVASPALKPGARPRSSPPLGLDGRPVPVCEDLCLASVPKRTSPLSDLAPPELESPDSTTSLPPPPASSALEGSVKDTEGGMFSGATVWLAKLAEPSRRLVESQTDSRGRFTLRLPSATKKSGLVVGASTASGSKAYELLDMLPVTRVHPLRLRLRMPGENYDEPSLGAVDAWLLERFKLVDGPKMSAESASGMYRLLRRYNHRPPSDWDRATEMLKTLRNHDAPEVRLVAAASLMRVGAWESAGEVIRGVEDPRFSHEKNVLEGVRLNFLRSPDEARRLLERTLLDETVDPFAQLELGRAAVMREDWSGALQHLDPAMDDKNLAPHAHYLRARCLFALGDMGAAAQEAKLLTHRVKKKRLPPQVLSFVEDLRGRLEEKSIVALRSVMTQSVSDLKKAEPSLAKLDTTPRPAGQGLSVILKKVGANIEKFFREFSNTSSLEVLRQSSLDDKGKPTSTRRAEMYYVFQKKNVKGRPFLEEIRGSVDGQRRAIGGLRDGFMVTTGFASSLIILHPECQPSVDYRYLGRQVIAGKAAYVLGFAQRPEDSPPMGIFRSPSRLSAVEVYVQGLAWISADKFQVLKLRTDLLKPLEEVDLNRETSEIDYRPYRFLTSPKTYLLPSRVTVSIDWRNRRLRNEHIFSRFWLFNVEADSGENRRLTRSQGLPQPVAAH